jgi:NAD(P)-dependent dehydrogenase (short-subunit alcohol dehydrogenase family)
MDYAIVTILLGGASLQIPEPVQESENMTRRTIVTGAADSVGLEIAKLFLARGDKVYVCDSNALAVETALACTPGLLGCVADVSDVSSTAEFLRSAVLALNGVDFLVNVVGLAGEHSEIEAASLKDWDRVFAANVRGMFQCIQFVTPFMKEQHFGTIVNFSSASTRTALPMRSSYVASKAAVEGLTRNVARELGPFNISCNAILPGLINNARAERVISSVAKAQGISLAEAQIRALAYTSMRCMIEPSEIAALASYLCSDLGHKISGQLIALDGNSEWEE